MSAPCMFRWDFLLEIVTITAIKKRRTAFFDLFLLSEISKYSKYYMKVTVPPTVVERGSYGSPPCTVNIYYISFHRTRFFAHWYWRYYQMYSRAWYVSILNHAYNFRTINWRNYVPSTEGAPKPRSNWVKWSRWSFL